MNTKKDLNESLYDVRTIRRRVAQKEIDPAEHQAWIDSIEDSASMCDNSQIRMVASNGFPASNDDLEEER